MIEPERTSETTERIRAIELAILEAAKLLADFGPERFPEFDGVRSDLDEALAKLITLRLRLRRWPRTDSTNGGRA